MRARVNELVKGLICVVSAVALPSVAADTSSTPVTMPVSYQSLQHLPVAEGGSQLQYGDSPLQTVLYYPPDGEPR